MLWDTIPVPKGTDADFAVAVTDDSLAPWIKKGGTAAAVTEGVRHKLM